jgi:hypothetical protein
LIEAGIDVSKLGAEIRDRIPTWSQVTALYGSEPILVGLETCEAFRNSGDPAEHLLAVAGSFNTGTNLLAELLIANCHMPARMKKYGEENRGVRWQVPWGKHTPVDDEQIRKNHKFAPEVQYMAAENVFPAVTIRDPALWMASMCHNEYAMQWTHSDGHCPNLVPNLIDAMEDPSLKDVESIFVTIPYKVVERRHESLLHHWNDWYGSYIHAQWPRLLVRFEDLIFHPKNVTQTICECAGGALDDAPFTYIVDSAKKGREHGKERTGYVDAIIRYGTNVQRWKGMTQQDLNFARQHVDRGLTEMFGYHNPPEKNVENI